MTGPSLLIVGDSKAGKSLSSIIGLVRAGFEVFVADFDCAAMYCLPFLTEEEKKRLHIKTFKDHFKWKTGEIRVMEKNGPVNKPIKIPTMPGTPCFSDFLGVLDDWKEGGTSYGSPFSWSSDRVLILDSGTEMGEAGMRKYLKEISKDGMMPRISDWSMPQSWETTVISDLIGAGCCFGAIYHLKHLRPPKLIEDDIDVVLEIQEDKAKKKGGAAEIDSTFTRTLWPTALGEKNAKYGVLKLFSLYVRVVRKGDGATIELRDNEDAPFAVPLPDAKKKEIEKLSAEKAIPRLFMEFGAQPQGV